MPSQNAYVKLIHHGNYTDPTEIITFVHLFGILPESARDERHMSTRKFAERHQRRYAPWIDL